MVAGVMVRTWDVAAIGVGVPVRIVGCKLSVNDVCALGTVTGPKDTIMELHSSFLFNRSNVI